VAPQLTPRRRDKNETGGIVVSEENVRAQVDAQMAIIGTPVEVRGENCTIVRDSGGRRGAEGCVRGNGSPNRKKLKKRSR